jgi:hypothetical protein
VKRLIGRPRRRREDKITMDFEEVGWTSWDFIQWSQDTEKRWAVVRKGMNLPVQ